jgi:hypothetical protein
VAEDKFISAHAPSDTAVPIIKNIFGVSADFLGELKTWLEQNPPTLPATQILGIPTSGKEYGYQEIATDTDTTSTTFVDLVTFDAITYEKVRHYFNLMIPILRHSVSSGSISFRLYDVTASAQVGNEIQLDSSPTAGGSTTGNVILPFTPADAGSRQYKVQWKVITAGTATIRTTGLAAASFRIYKS